MLDNRDSDLKLLVMLERLLEVSSEKRDENLEKYASLVKEIDAEKYNIIVNKIDDMSNNHNQSLEEELIFLEEIENEYEQLNQLQFKYRNIYERHSFETLKLSSISTIDIDAIVDRKNLISGYLINVKNIDNNQSKLKKCNEDLILEDRKRISMEQRLIALEEELKNDFVSAKGRIYSKDSACNVDFSIVSEYENVDLDLLALVDDEELLNKMLNEVYELRKDKEEELKTAELCYNHMPSKDSKELLDLIRLEVVKVKYKLSLLKIVELISIIEKTCDTVKIKREDLIDLVKFRNGCLEQLGIKFVLDPFNKIKLSEQLNFVSLLNDNSKKISMIRKEINTITNNLEELETQNVEFTMALNKPVVFIREEIVESTLEDESANEPEIITNNSFEDLLMSINNNDDTIVIVDAEPNKVVRISDFSKGFMYDRALEKTRGVIKRVNDMMVNESYITEKKEVIPELVLEESKGFVDKETDDLFQELSPFEDAILFGDRFDDVVNNDIDFLEDIVKESSTNEKLSLNDDNNFSLESSFFDNIGNGFENQMSDSDVFWVTQGENSGVSNNENIISFDDQIGKLIESEKDIKVKKLAA